MKPIQSPFGKILTLIALIAFPILLGAGIALSSSPASVSQFLSRKSLNNPSPGQSPTSSPSPSPKPIPATTPGPGQLALNPNLIALGHGALEAQTATDLLLTTDQGQTWSAHHLPASMKEALADPSNLLHIVAAGDGILNSTDGVTFAPTSMLPPNPNTYLPLLISPAQGGGWFFSHNGGLLRTRDGGGSWKDFTPPASGSIIAMVAGATPDQYFVGIGSHIVGYESVLGTFQDKGEVAPGVKVAALAYVGGSATGLLVHGSNGKDYFRSSGTWTESGGGLSGPVGGTGTGIALVADGSNQTSAGHINYSTDAGVTWGSGQGLPMNESVDALAAEPDGSKVYAYCFGGDIYASSDGGRNWTLYGSGLRTAR